MHGPFQILPFLHSKSYETRSAAGSVVSNICTLVPSLTEDLLSSVDQPLEVRRCKKTGRDYLLCDYNRDGHSYRSPWSVRQWTGKSAHEALVVRTIHVETHAAKLEVPT